MINILLATYNSSEYIRQQLDSLFAQTNQDWTLLVRDDCSTDNTLDIINEYQERYPRRIVIIDNHGISLRAYMNFVTLLQAADADYYMFCDHDDVWLPRKIEISLKRMHEIEEKTSDKPIIVHTDMKVVDQHLKVISDSFWSFSNLLPDSTSFLDMIHCNSANGCAMMFNQKAKEVSIPNVNNATMHDILLNQSVSANGGIISPIKIPMVLYRQHGDNVVGAQRRDWRFYIHKLCNISFIIKKNIDSYKMANSIKPISILLYISTKVKIIFRKKYIYNE